jgi:hypothetical protein
MLVETGNIAYESQDSMDPYLECDGEDDDHEYPKKDVSIRSNISALTMESTAYRSKRNVFSRARKGLHNRFLSSHNHSQTLEKNGSPTAASASVSGSSGNQSLGDGSNGSSGGGAAAAEAGKQQRRRRPRRRSFFGSIAEDPDTSAAQETAADESLEAHPKRGRRRSFFGSNGTTETAPSTNGGAGGEEKSNKKAGSEDASQASIASSKAPHRSRRRSLFGSMTGANNHDDHHTPDSTSHSPSSEDSGSSPITPVRLVVRRPHRRRSLFGSMPNMTTATATVTAPAVTTLDAGEQPAQPTTSPGASPSSTRSAKKSKKKNALAATPASPAQTKSLVVRAAPIHVVVNQERLNRGMVIYSRNMVLDSKAQELSKQLAESDGNTCTPSSYHGNVGQGASIHAIHATMMKDKQGTARQNILSTDFSEFGMAMSRGQDGLLYMVQLFK